MTSVSDAERRQRLASRHRLVPGRRLSAAEPESLATIADDVVALHASDPATVYLTAAARLNEPSVDAVASSLYESRRLVRHHAMRRTIWVMSHAVLPVAHRSTTLKIAQAERRRLLNVLDRNDRWLDAAIEEIAALTREHGPSQTRTIGQLLPHLAFEVTVGSATKHPATVRAHTRVVVQGGFEGKLCRTRPVGSWTASTYAWVAAGAWHDHDLSSMGTDPTRQREAKADLVERWLLRFGPGTETDISWWTGMTKTDVRNALSDTGAQEVDLASGTGWLSGADTAVAAGAEQASAAEPWVALLPGLDPSAMGWKHRDWYLDDDVASEVTDRNGNIGPTVWADGRVIGGWNQRPNGELVSEIYRPVGVHHQRLLADETDRIGAFIGDTVVKPRFPSPNQKRLILS